MDALELRRRRRRIVGLAAAALLLVALPLLLQLGGIRWFVVSTSSMGRAAPVGTLVVTAPVTAEQVRDGEILAFRPPGTDVVYTHRATDASGAGIRTRGDLDAADDPWRLRTADLVGRAVLVAPGAGYLLEAVPVLIVGGLLAAALGRLTKRRATRLSLRLAVLSVTASAAVALHVPLAAVTVLTAVPTAAGGMTVRLVATGLLPVEVTGAAEGATLVAGQAAVLTLPSAASWTVTTQLALAWWGWVLVAAVAALPSVVSWIAAVAVARSDRAAAVA